MRRPLRPSASAVPFGLGPALAMTAVGTTVAAVAILWSMTVTPTTVAKDETKTFHVRIQNRTAVAEIYCVKIDVPGVLDFESVKVTGTNAATSWTASDSSSGGSGTRIFLRPSHPDGHVHQGEWVEADVVATGKSVGLGLWKAWAYSATDCTGLLGALPELQVGVTVVSTATPTPVPSPSPMPTPTPLPSIAPSPLPSLLPSIAPASPTPRPSVRPSIAPTPTPKPTPAPTPTPNATPTPSVRPSVAPSASPSPGTPSPGASAPAASPSTGPGASPSPNVGASPAPSAAASPSASPAGGTTILPGGPGAGPGSGDPNGSGSGGSGGTGSGDSAKEPVPPIRLADAALDEPVSGSIGVGLDALRLLDDGHEWLVPLFVVSIPGFLVVLAILGQSLAGLVWLVPVRRSLGATTRPFRGRRPGMP
jgi:outer membrane biosynthesis protein TonB